MKKSRILPRAALTILFAALVFAILLITMCIVGLIGLLLIHVGILHRTDNAGLMLGITVLAVASILVGTVVGAVMSRFPLKPVKHLIIGMNRLAEGDYTARIDLGRMAVAQRLSKSFNTLAEELQNTEMLRSDFVNNFSHEFKTPIVSIRGFAKLLQKGSLSDAQQQEYIGIIAEESTRLADMATSVLNLTKVENQSILTDTTRFNLSEQLRGCVLLLEKRWSGKGLTIAAPFDEHDIHANEELLKQVWINLLDNAVKFSPQGEEIGISIVETADTVTVSIKNRGQEIREEDKVRIFGKFYQGDTSRSGEGTGIGLAIVKRIVDLHEGVVTLTSSPDATVFTVRLPKK